MFHFLFFFLLEHVWFYFRFSSMVYFLTTMTVTILQKKSSQKHEQLRPWFPSLLCFSEIKTQISLCLSFCCCHGFCIRLSSHFSCIKDLQVLLLLTQFVYCHGWHSFLIIRFYLSSYQEMFIKRII